MMTVIGYKFVLTTKWFIIHRIRHQLRLNPHSPVFNTNMIRKRDLKPVGDLVELVEGAEGVELAKVEEEIRR